MCIRDRTKTLRFTSSPVNSLIPGTVSTAVDKNYESAGTIETLQETIINTRNADIVTENLTDNRVLTDVRRRQQRRDTGVIRTSTSMVTQRLVTEFYDPLAQTFDVGNPNGVFLTSCDLFFSTAVDTVPGISELTAEELNLKVLVPAVNCGFSITVPSGT